MSHDYLQSKRPDWLNYILVSNIHYYSDLKKNQQKEDKFNALAQNIFTASISILAATWIADTYSNQGKPIGLIEKLIIFIFLYFISLLFLSPLLVTALDKLKYYCSRLVRELLGRHSLKENKKDAYQIGFELRGQIPNYITLCYELLDVIPETKQDNLKNLYLIELYTHCATIQNAFQDFVHLQETIIKKKAIDRLQATHLLAITKTLFNDIKNKKLFTNSSDINIAFDNFSNKIASYSINNPQ